MPNEDHSKEANTLLSKIKTIVSSQGYSFERPSRDRIGADYGFIISKQGFNVYGALYNTKMTGQIWKEIKPAFYEICKSRVDSCFVILNDLVKDQHVIIPYRLLQYCLNPKYSGGRTLWQFALQRDQVNPSRTNYHLLKYKGGTIDIPESYVNNFQPLLESWQERSNVEKTIGERSSSVILSAAPSLIPTHRKSIDYEEPPASIVVETVRRIRDTAKARELKTRYSNLCQICQTRLKLRLDQFYSEVHHLRPLGGRAQGLDNEDNMLVLCPNHHALFDYLGIGIDPVDMSTVIDVQGNIVGKLNMLKDHSLNPTNIQYHYEQMTRNQRD